MNILLRRKNELKSVRGKWVQMVRNYCSAFTVSRRNWLSSVLTADTPGSRAKGKTALKNICLQVDFFWKRESKHLSLSTETLCHPGGGTSPRRYSSDLLTVHFSKAFSRVQTLNMNKNWFSN